MSKIYEELKYIYNSTVVVGAMGCAGLFFTGSGIYGNAKTVYEERTTDTREVAEAAYQEVYKGRFITAEQANAIHELRVRDANKQQSDKETVIGLALLGLMGRRRNNPPQKPKTG